MTTRTILGDCSVILRTLDDNSVDSMVTDPPAGIAFMGKAWDKDKGGRDSWIAWMAEVMAEALRVVKPGGHGLVWALPRTSHWTATALEDAGWEIRDRIAHINGQGFPKSLDISKALDKLAGAEREVLGKKATYRKPQTTPNGWECKTRAENETAPATEAARQWDGWKSALKPAVEDYWLVRKPLSESSIARNVLEHGVGGLNIGGCRVPTEDNLNGGAYSGAKRSRPEKTSTDTAPGAVPLSRLNSGIGTLNDHSGRYPAHLVLSHSPECGDICAESCPIAELDRQSGVLTSGSSSGKRSGLGYHGASGNQGKAYDSNSGGASRFFYCAKAPKREKYVYLTCDCKAPIMSRWVKEDRNQSARTDTTSPRKGISVVTSTDECDSSTALSGRKQTGQSPTSTASTTSTRTNKTTGLTTCASSHSQSTSGSTQGVNSETANGGSLVGSAVNSSQSQQITGTSQDRAGRSTGVVVHATLGSSVRGRVCRGCGAKVRLEAHPTQKSTKLMRYLCRLVTPPGGVVLDPFMGSGSTGVAAVQERFSFIGIEEDQDYLDTAVKRLDHAAKRLAQGVLL